MSDKRSESGEDGSGRDTSFSRQNVGSQPRTRTLSRSTRLHGITSGTGNGTVNRGCNSTAAVNTDGGVVKREEHILLHGGTLRHTHVLWDRTAASSCNNKGIIVACVNSI